MFFQNFVGCWPCHFVWLSVEFPYKGLQLVNVMIWPLVSEVFLCNVLKRASIPLCKRWLGLTVRLERVNAIVPAKAKESSFNFGSFVRRNFLWFDFHNHLPKNWHFFYSFGSHWIISQFLVLNVHGDKYVYNTVVVSGEPIKIDNMDEPYFIIIESKTFKLSELSTILFIICMLTFPWLESRDFFPCEFTFYLEIRYAAIRQTLSSLFYSAL